MKAQFLVLMMALSLATLTQAQVPLAPLWPNDDGMRWAYDMHVVDIMQDIDMSLDAFLALEGTTMTPGGEAQNLIAETNAEDRPVEAIQQLAKLFHERG